MICNPNNKIFYILQEIDNKIFYFIKRNYDFKYLFSQKAVLKNDYLDFLNKKYNIISEISEINRNYFIRICNGYYFTDLVHNILLKLKIPVIVSENIISFLKNEPINKNSTTKINEFLADFLMFQNYYSQKLIYIENERQSLVTNKTQKLYFNLKSKNVHLSNNQNQNSFRVKHLLDSSNLKNNMLILYKKYK